jgi:transposase-like protein
MGTHRRWSKEVKLAILEEAARNGIAQTSRKHGIAASQVHDWKKKFELSGEDAETHRLRLENQALKEMIAEQALALRIKDSLLKKTDQRLRSGS